MSKSKISFLFVIKMRFYTRNNEVSNSQNIINQDFIRYNMSSLILAKVISICAIMSIVFANNVNLFIFLFIKKHLPFNYL